MAQFNCCPAPAHDGDGTSEGKAPALSGAYFDEAALTAMRKALDAVCERLAIHDDGAERGEVASVILRLAHNGIHNDADLVEAALAEIQMGRRDK